uniref:Uncharacterized protein n=1 Tax=Anguilla anguilla TaxID=7936 RepID=A0A0E9PQP0_ANGAN
MFICCGFCSFEYGLFLSGPRVFRFLFFGFCSFLSVVFFHVYILDDVVRLFKF